MVDYSSSFECFCLCCDWNLAEENNGVVNPEDAKAEEVEEVDKMEEGWQSHLSFT